MIEEHLIAVVRDSDTITNFIFMPLVPFPISLPTSYLGGFWKIEESEEYLIAQLQLLPEEIAYLATYKDSEKRKEWLASRLIIRELLQPSHPLLSITLADGSPNIQGWEGRVSISHTQGWAAALIGTSGIPGIDVELRARKIPEFLRNRFLHSDEKSQGNLSIVENSHEMAVIAWSAKETLFKIAGRKGISFQQDLFVNLPERLEEKNGIFQGYIRNHGSEKKLNIHYILQEEFICTWAVWHDDDAFL